MDKTDLFEYKEWDSSFFNQAIYSVNCEHLSELNANAFEDLENALIQVKIPADSVAALDKVQEHGFIFVESEIDFTSKFCIPTLEKGCMSAHSEFRVHDAQLEDTAEIQALVADSFVYSRFRHPWFQKTDMSRFYSEWSRKAVLNQYDDVCLKIEDPAGQEICGIVTAKLLNEHEVRIGLICVSSAFRGKNLGSILLDSLKDWAFSRNIQKIHVATQGSNQRACLLYLNNGYQLNEVRYWFYKRVTR